MNMQKEKVLFLEWLRSVCAITVVLDHVAISAIHYYEEGASALDTFRRTRFPDDFRVSFARPVKTH